MANLAISSIMPALETDPSPLDTLPRPLAVVIHDAGAANMIAAWAKGAKAPPDLVIAAGPAAAIWASRFGGDAISGSDPGAVKDAACVLSGTGWASDLEHRARIAAAQSGARSVAVVDHWVNYPMRFERDGTVQLPDTIWVADADAAAIARSCFTDTRIDQHPNTYMMEQAREAGPCPANGDALFLLEPARSDWGGDGEGEFQALGFFMANRGALSIADDTPVRIRPHPSDPPGKYDAWIAANPAATLDTSPDMATALASARWVIGMNSAALVIALEAGREVASALPPHAPTCVLPHSAIKHLAAL